MAQLRMNLMKFLNRRWRLMMRFFPPRNLIRRQTLVDFYFDHSLDVVHRIAIHSWFMLSWLHIVLWKSRSPLVIPMKFHSPPLKDPKLHYESLMKGWNQYIPRKSYHLSPSILPIPCIYTIFTGVLIALPSAPAQDWIKASSRLHRLAQVAWRGRSLET